MVVIQPVANSPLLLQSTQYAKLVNCLFFFHNNLGTALIVFETSITLTENGFIHITIVDVRHSLRDVNLGVVSLLSTAT